MSFLGFLPIQRAYITVVSGGHIVKEDGLDVDAYLPKVNFLLMCFSSFNTKLLVFSLLISPISKQLFKMSPV
jgi:hypothetical protein